MVELVQLRKEEDMATAFASALEKLVKEPAFRTLVQADPSKLGEEFPNLTNADKAQLVQVWESITGDNSISSVPHSTVLASASSDVYCCCCCCIPL